jgi:glycosyltransferase involved in cell wall biosynthesis
LAPGHRGRRSAQLDNALLGNVIRRRMTGRASGSTVSVGMLPWQWPAVSRLPGRRVFDCADNWAALIPQRATRMRALYRRIGAEASTVIVVNEDLAELFGDAAVVVVPNGANDDAATGAPTPLPRQGRLVYVGTLSERFDAPLLQQVLDLLPGWNLTLYGACHYSGHGTQPSPELLSLLDRGDGRVSWQGLVPRSDLGAHLDAADVLVLPHRSDQTVGQSSMKMFDYAARGRPIVSTGSGLPESAPHVRFANTAQGFVTEIQATMTEPDAWAASRIEWARANSWSARWPAWSAAALGNAR